MRDRETLESTGPEAAGHPRSAKQARDVARRRVSAGLAWSVPIVVMGAPARAVAASTCPTLTYVLDASNRNYDEIRITNTGTTSLAVGTTITWVVYNRSPFPATLTIAATSGVTASPTSLGIASGASGTFTFSLSAPLAPGQALYWRYRITGWNYASRVTVNGCPGATACLSSNLYTPGGDCPPTARVAGRAAVPTEFPDPAEIPPK